MFDIKKASVSKLIRCKGYILTDPVRNFISNLVTYLCNMKNYDINSIKSIFVKVIESDNTIYLKVFFDDHISHIPITKHIFIVKSKGRKYIDFLKEKNN